MKATTFLTASLLATLALTACTNEENPSALSEGQVDIRTTICTNTGIDARVSLDNNGSGNFETNDVLGLYAYVGNTEIKQNISYKLGETKLHWDELSKSDAVTFSAYYPKAENIITPEAYEFNAATATNPDLLIATPVTAPKGNSVTLDFKHAMHKLVVKLSSNVYSDDDIAVATVTPMNMNASATVNILTGTVTAGEVTVTDGQYASQTGAVTSFIIAPQKVTTDADWIQISIGDKAFTYKVPANYTKPNKEKASLSQLNTGEILTLELAINRDAVELDGGSISGWNDGGSASGSINWNEGTATGNTIDMTQMTAEKVKTAIKAALTAGAKEFKLVGEFSKTGIGEDVTTQSPGKNPFAGTNVEKIDLTGVTGWPEVDIDGDDILDNATGLPVFAFFGTQNNTSNYPNLKEVKLPADVKAIGYGAFFHCPSLTAVSLDKVEIIGNAAFQLCSSLTTVNLPAVKTLKDDAFTNCTSLQTVNITTASNDVTIGKRAFYGCSKLETINAPAVKEVGYAAFMECATLATVTLANAEKIDNSAFSGCSALQSLILPKATAFGPTFISRCSSLTVLKLTAAKSFTTPDGTPLAESNTNKLGAFNMFPNAPQCALTLNADKNSEGGSATPKATVGGTWCWGRLNDNEQQTDVKPIQWKSISYTGN